MSKKEILIKKVASGSIAEEAGVEPGDVLLGINGSDVSDMIEYRFLTTDEYITILIRKASGEEWEIEIEKDYNDDLGIEFDDPCATNPKRCHNKCIFCFIDQLPKGLRESLYFKDDDSRLSFIHGNFVTLTNMKDEDIDRIIKYRISPINVSVHTTNPELRVKMLNNNKAGEIMNKLKKLTSQGISVNCQIVLCPGINDGEELKKTIMDLYSLHPGVMGVAIVPVGITKYREGLFELYGYNKESSTEVINFMNGIQEKIQNEIGEPFARLADEFYMMAGVELPDEKHYGDFEQLEDGIGMIRYLRWCITEDLNNTTCKGEGESIALITGSSASNVMKEIAEKISKEMNVKIEVYPVKNKFFGERITVAGLLTAEDIIEQTSGIIKEEYVLIPSNMLKADEDIFLDDVSLEEFQNKMGTKVIKCKYTGEDLIEKIANEVLLCQNLSQQ